MARACGANQGAGVKSAYLQANGGLRAAIEERGEDTGELVVATASRATDESVAVGNTVSHEQRANARPPLQRLSKLSPSLPHRTTIGLKPSIIVFKTLAAALKAHDE